MTAPKCPLVVGGRSSALTLRWPNEVPIGAVVEIARDQSGPKAAVPSEPGAFLRARERHVDSEKDRELVFNLLDPATWYWIRTRRDEPSTVYSRTFAVRTPAAKPEPVGSLDASYTLYDGDDAANARGRHMFIKLKWAAGNDRGADIEEYIVQRCSASEPDWKIVYRTTSCACVLSAMVSLSAFEYTCTFAVTGRNAMGLSREAILDVAFAVPAARRGRDKRSGDPDFISGTNHSGAPASRRNRQLQRTRRLVRDYLDSDLIVDESEPSAFRIEKRKAKKTSPGKKRRGESRSARDSSRLPHASPRMWRDASSSSPFDDEVASLKRKLLSSASTKTSLLTITAGPLDDDDLLGIGPAKNELVFKPSPPPPSASPKRHSPRGKNPYRQKFVRPTSRRKLPMTNESNRKLLASIAAASPPAQSDAAALKKHQLLWTHAYKTTSHIPIKSRRFPDGGRVTADRADEDDEDDEEEETEVEEDPFVRDLEMLSGAEAYSLLEPPPPPTSMLPDQNSVGADGEGAGILRRDASTPRDEDFARDASSEAEHDRADDGDFDAEYARRTEAIARAEEEARARAIAEEAEAQRRAEEGAKAEEARKRAEAEAERAQALAEAEAARERALAEQARLEEEARVQAEAEKQDRAATLLQRNARGSLARSRCAQQLREVVRIQSVMRMAPPRMRALRRRAVTRAAERFMTSVILSAQRHCEEESRVMVDVAAIRLQSRFRQFGAKRRYTRMIEQRHAAVTVQKHVRTLIARRSISKQQTAATMIQARFRSHQEQVRFEQRVHEIVVRAAIRLQACYRAHHAQKQLGQRKRHILKSIVRVNVSGGGTRSVNGSYEQMEVTDAAKYIMTPAGTNDTYLIERSEVQEGQVPIWTLKLVKESGETILLYVNKLEGGSLKPPVREWEAISGRPPAPTLVCKTSDSYLKDMELMNREAVVITDSGCPEVHGRYFQSGIADGVPQFVLQKAESTFMLLRSPYADRRIWLLVGSLVFHLDQASEDAAAATAAGSTRNVPLKPRTPATPGPRRASSGALSTKRIYYVNMEYGAADKPPLDGWQVAQHGKLPEPLFVRQRKLQAEED